jgi:predicted nucleotidyltransferase
LQLWAGREPLDFPRDRALSDRVIELQATTSAHGKDGLQIDFSLVMAGFTFDEIWTRSRMLVVDGINVPVARLTDIVQSKANAGREKDRLFLATHAEALKQLSRYDLD